MPLGGSLNLLPLRFHFFRFSLPPRLFKTTA